MEAHDVCRRQIVLLVRFVAAPCSKLLKNDLWKNHFQKNCITYKHCQNSALRCIMKTSSSLSLSNFWEIPPRGSLLFQRLL